MRPSRRMHDALAHQVLTDIPAFMSPTATQSATTFTLEQATATLPLVRAIMRDVLQLDRKVRHLRFRLKFINRGGDELTCMFTSEIQSLERDLETSQNELDRITCELLELGIEPEGLGLGLVDFPTVREGNPVYFCWRYGESSIEFWHSLTGGFPNRNPLRDSREHQLSYH